MPFKIHLPRSLLPLLLLLLQHTPVFSFVAGDHNELPNQMTSFQIQKSLENSLGLRLDEFEPGKQFDINGVTFTVNQDTIDVKPDEGLQDVRFGIETLGSEAAIFGGLSPVGIIDKLPANEKITVTNQNNIVEIELNNDDDTSSLNVKLNGEDILNKEDEEQLVVFVDIDQAEESLKISYQDQQGSLKIVQNLETGERSSGDVETQDFEYEMDEMSGYDSEADWINKQGQAVIKKLSAEQLRGLKNAKEVRVKSEEEEESEIIDIIIFEREVFVFQGDKDVGAFVLKKQEVIEFKDQDGEGIQVVLTPEGQVGVKADILLNGDAVQTKEADYQLEIVIEVTSEGPKITIAGDEDEKIDFKERSPKEHKLSPEDYLIREQ